ncbi:uncharacterized protein [Nicotiana tomentosiformis]|uniref:uncharacterized protein n=1 Tax=Nicotiana tomentosiformis TaxID=4098 RepID=UPI00388C4872
MYALTWNIRSVNTQRTFERRITMQRQYHFDFIGIMEPMQRSRKLEKYRRQSGFAQAIVNTSNKIWAFIYERFDVTVVIDMVWHLTLKLDDIEDHKEFILTLVYAKCDHFARIELCDSLYYLARDMTTPWLGGGDFNVIWDEKEKFGRLPVSLNVVDNFRHCINTCNRTDMGFKGSIYTWWNGRAEEDFISKRLDQVFANMELQLLWPGLEITHLSKIGSDHRPLLIAYNPESVPIKKSFRFLNFWTKHESFKAVVKENWQEDFHANSFILFNYKLKKLKKALSTWRRATFGDIFQKIASLEEVVRAHEAQFELHPTLQNRERLQKVQAELFKYLALEEQFWKQKSGMTWFTDGDRNTKFFHAHVNGKRKRLQLKRIQNNDGDWIEDREEMAIEVVKFFEA